MNQSVTPRAQQRLHNESHIAQVGKFSVLKLVEENNSQVSISLKASGEDGGPE
jgi:hypothetical protein